jgi:CheY-like chemotaxis protein
LAKHALIVHPDAEAFHVYRDILQEEGMRAQWVKDGLGACEYVQANGDIGLVVVELSLTGVDGFRVLKTLAQTGNAGTPVLVVSAFHALLLSAFRQRRELGIHRLLRTPAPDDAVRPVLRRLLRHEASTAEMPKWTASGAAEAKRLRSLERIGAREPNAQMDRALQLVVDRVARDLGVPIAALSLVLEDRQWFRVRAGTELEETPLDQSFCRHVVQANESLVVADATVHPTFADNTLVRHRLVRGYAGAPLVGSDGEVWGALCVIDPEKPLELGNADMEKLRAVAKLVAAQLEAHPRHPLPPPAIAASASV